MSFDVQFPGLGLEFTINRVALSIGGFNIYWYGVIIAAGMVLAMLFAFRNADDFGINSDRLIDVILVGAVMAIVCARIYYIVFAPFKYESIWQMIDIRQGGIAIYGAVIGAFVFGGLMAKIRRIPILPLFDLVGICFLIGQGVGRWGNFVNQEAFGSNTTLPWGMYSEGTYNYLLSVQATLAAEGVTVDPTQPVHPTFLYESIWCLAGVVIDRFGRGTPCVPDGPDAFICTVEVAVSPNFFGWLASFGARAQLLSPAPVREAFVALCRAAEAANT